MKMKITANKKKSYNRAGGRIYMRPEACLYERSEGCLYRRYEGQDLQIFKRRLYRQSEYVLYVT